MDAQEGPRKDGHSLNTIPSLARAVNVSRRIVVLRLCANQSLTAVSSVKFTPDGRRVVAVATQKIRIWDVATGVEEDAFQRSFGSSSDRLAISPDGRWLAITGPGHVSILDISPPAP
jgi:WD40 repeat protein